MRTCKSPNCTEKFEPFYSSMQPTCGKIQCAIEYGKAQQEKARKREVAQTKREIRDNSVAWWKAVGNAEANKNGGNCAYWLHRFIRLVRDAGRPCIICNQPLDPKDAHACHYRSRGAADHLRFHEDNIHSGHHWCNTHTTGDTAARYRTNLIERIGEARVQALETDNTTHHWIIEDDGEDHPLHLRPLRVIRDDYKQRCKEFGV